MKVKFEATCEIPNETTDIRWFIQKELDIMEETRKNMKNTTVISVEEEKEPESRKDIIKGEICPVCGYNNEMKIIDLNNEYFTCNCPQCHSTFKVNLLTE